MLDRRASFSARSETSRDNDFNNMLASLGKRGGGSARDDASDTSSQRERKFAAMIGDDEAGHLGGFAATGGSIPSAPVRNVGDRLFQVGCSKEREKNERLREERDRQLMSEMAQMTQRPNITQRARTRPGKGSHFCEHAMIWEEKKREHRDEMARAIHRDISKDVTGSPSINRTSVEIVQQRGDYSGPVSGWEEHFARFCAKRSNTTTQSGTMFNPNINANAVRAGGDKPISERLFEEFSERRERRRQAVLDAQQQELVDKATGRQLFTPQALQPGSTGRRPEEVSQQLYEDNSILERRRADAVEKLDPDMTFTPKVNETSAYLASKVVRRPLHEPKRAPTDGQFTPGRGTMNSARSRSTDDINSQPNSTPKVSVREFLQRTQRADAGRASRIAAIKNAMHERDTSECTFQPRINSKSQQIFESTNAAGTPMASPSVALGSPYADAQPQAGLSPKSGSKQFSRLSRAAATELEAAMLAADISPAYPPAQEASPARLNTSVRPRSPAHTQVSTPGRTAVGGQAPSSNLASPVLPATGRSTGRTPMPSGPARTADVAQPTELSSADHYIQQFERQMYAVLDEWRRLEEV